MSPTVTPATAPEVRSVRAGSRRKRADRIGDRVLYGVCLTAALLTVVVMILVAYQVFHGASPAISKFGLGFFTHTTWQPNFNKFGGGAFLFGTLVTSSLAILLGAPIAISIGLYLSLLAPNGIRGLVSPLVEMLAAIPSVILGFWGILVLAPFVHKTIEPFLHSTLGFIPLFGAPETTGASVFTASLILTKDLQDGASALGATKWEVMRGVVLPSTSSGIIAATLLGLGRALGEAIAVAQVIGAGNGIFGDLFKTGDTMAARIANEFPSALTELHKASLYYLGAALLVIGLVSNLAAQWVGRRFSYNSGGVTR
jgi:phosphate transport system permease protein